MKEEEKRLLKIAIWRNIKVWFYGMK